MSTFLRTHQDDDKRGAWQSVSAMAQAGHGTKSQFYDLISPSGKIHVLPEGNCWRYTKARMDEAIEDERIWFGKTGNNVPRIKKFLKESQDSGAGLTPETIWYADEVGTTDTAKKHVLGLCKGGAVFDTPKSEGLIERIIHIASNRGDLILDSFLGSGTTAAVAHKMGRRWIGVELGDHCETHCLPRLKKVIESEDPGGITESVNWKGGGGLRYYDLGPSLIAEDKWGNPVISSKFDPPMLAQAMCKIEGFDYAPETDSYWMQGHSSESDFIYVTTQTMSKSALEKLSDEVGDNRSLLVCCPSFRAKEGDFPNLTLKKIPKAVLKKCEWGKDDYSLQIQELPAAPKPEPEAEAPKKKAKRKFGKANDNKQSELF